MDEIIFLGDSLTEGGDWDAYFPGCRNYNYGIGGNTTTDVIERLPEMYKHSPSKIFLMIGINDLGNQTPPGAIVNNIQTILKELAVHTPGAKRFLLSLLPVDYTMWERILPSPQTIQKVNIQLRNIAEENNATFVDLTSEFSDESGSLNPSLSTDGLHLNRKGYDVWAKCLNEFIYNR